MSVDAYTVPASAKTIDSIIVRQFLNLQKLCAGIIDNMTLGSSCCFFVGNTGEAGG
jgi:hypothetical protein